MKELYLAAAAFSLSQQFLVENEIKKTKKNVGNYQHNQTHVQIVHATTSQCSNAGKLNYFCQHNFIFICITINE